MTLETSCRKKLPSLIYVCLLLMKTLLHLLHRNTPPLSIIMQLSIDFTQFFFHSKLKETPKNVKPLQADLAGISWEVFTSSLLPGCAFIVRFASAAV